MALWTVTQQEFQEAVQSHAGHWTNFVERVLTLPQTMYHDVRSGQVFGIVYRHRDETLEYVLIDGSPSKSKHLSTIIHLGLDVKELFRAAKRSMNRREKEE